MTFALLAGIGLVVLFGLALALSIFLVWLVMEVCS